MEHFSPVQMSDPEQMARADSGRAVTYFDSIVESFSDQYLHKASFRDRLNLFLEAVRATTRPPARILDFGCGPGTIALALAQAGYEVVGLDGAAGMVDRARGRQRELNIQNAQFDVAGATEPTFGAAEFDAVVCSSVIEYVENDVALVANLVRALKPGGRLVISVPHTPSLGSLAEEVVRFKRRLLAPEESQHLDLHLRRYRRRQLVAELSRLGIDQVRCTTFELPILGELGVQLSRIRWIGVMLLISGRKIGDPVGSMP